MRSRTVYIVYFIFAIVSLNGQPSLRLHIHDLCYDYLVPVEAEVVDNYGNSQILLSDSIIQLSNPGEYFISISYLRNGRLKLISNTFSIPDEPFELIITIPRIAKFHADESVLSPTLFYNCTEVCDGFCKSRYDNGSIQIEGKFSEGKPIGKIKYYNKDGTQNRIEKYNRKGNLIKIIKPSA